MGGRCVGLQQGLRDRATEYGDDPVATALHFEAAGARLLHVVDLDAALETGDNREVVTHICRTVSVPVQVGGGIRSLDDVEGTFALGAARAILGTAAVMDPGLVREAVGRHGDRVLAAVDVHGEWVMVRGWQEPVGLVDDVLPLLHAAGTPRFLVTAIQADGTLEGPDLELYARVRRLTDRPVLASGGIRSAYDLRALSTLRLEGAVVGRALYEGTLSLAEAFAAVLP